MNNTEIAKSVIEAIGGKDNVSSVAHCATRLRIMVKDKEKIDTNRVENIEKVQGAFFNAGQFQIIFGTGTVNRIYDEVVSLGLPTSTTKQQNKETGSNVLFVHSGMYSFQSFQRLLQQVFSWVFVDY